MTLDAPTNNSRSPAIVWLVPIAGPLVEPVELNAEKPDGMTVGRAEQCDVCLPPEEERVSRSHARFAFRDGRWCVADLNSRWGTFLNGIRLSPNTEMPLKDGDLIRITPWTFMLSPTAKRGGVQAQNDQGQTFVRAVTAEKARPLADDMLALLLESAAAIHAALDEKQLAELIMDSACRGTGLTNAAMLRPIDASGRIEVIASRSASSLSTPVGMQPGMPTGGMGIGAKPQAADGGNPFVTAAARGQHHAYGSSTQPQATFSRSLITAASNGVVAELSGGNLGSSEDISQSIVQMKINNAICVPLMLGNTVAQFLYLDSRSTSMQSLRPNASAFCVALGRMASLALANLKRIEMEKREASIRADLSAAATAQKWIMPRRETTHGVFNCLGESRAGQYVGGDFFDIIPLPGGNRLAVAVGDVAGKGIAASVLMTATQGFLHAALLHHADPQLAVNSLNNFIKPRRPEHKFVTMWVGVFDADAGTVCYVDAGHSYALLRRADGTTFEQLDKGGGLPIGIDEIDQYTSETIHLQPGDEVMVVSDGIIEQFGIVQDAAGALVKDQFQMGGVQRAMEHAAKDRVAELFDAVVAHAGTTQLSDDATAVLVKW